MKAMEWEDYWSRLLKEKKLLSKVNEMDQADELLENQVKIEEICHQIYDDYKVWREELKETREEFLRLIGGLAGVHLQCSRIKSLESLLGKVVTKRYANLKNDESEYARINGSNYKDIITDLIGMRLIINYRGKWTQIHEEILREFPYAAQETYQKESLLPHPKDGRGLQVEMPKVYYAQGDTVGQYENYGLEVKLHDKGYRSIHYTVSFWKTYIEIQVRTIYDEAWSDCDHNYVYKQEQNRSHTALEQISAILCKLTNASNDIGEGMREIFEKQSFIENGKNCWYASSEDIQSLDVALNRVREAQEELEDFRGRLEPRQ